MSYSLSLCLRVLKLISCCSQVDILSPVTPLKMDHVKRTCHLPSISFQRYSLDFLSFQRDYMWRKISLAQLQLSSNFCSTEPMGKELKIRNVDYFPKTTEIRCHDFSKSFLAPNRFKDSNQNIGRRCGQTR